MTKKYLLLCAAVAAPFTLPVAAVAADQADNPAVQPVLTDVILVTADNRTAPQAADGLEPPRTIALPADAVAIAARAAGAAAIGNGALSGQLSYRGLFGERVLGRINGQRFATGGPNAMDPPLHYAPSILVERIEIARGVAPVSEGPSLGGAINAELRQAAFSSSANVEAAASAAAQYRSVDNSYAAGGLLGLATQDWRIGVIASRERGDDYRIPGGNSAAQAGGTSFERNLYGIHAGLAAGGGELFAEYRRSETDPSGNPPFALDIVYFNTDFVQGGWRGDIADGASMLLRLGHANVQHLMDNQTIRQPAAPPMMARATFADAQSFTAETSLRLGTDSRNVTFGLDAELVQKFVRITNPFNANFYIDAQPDLGADRLGGFVQWRGGGAGAEWELGARLDHVRQDAGIPDLGSAVPMGPTGLAAAFTGTARKVRDTVADAVLRLWLPGEAGLTPRLTLARKNRVPSLLERFAWLPTEASYGLADGNIYVGNQALKPEVAHLAELGLDMETGKVSLRPTIFYRRVDNFIQGTPFDDTPGIINSPVEMVSAMNGDPTPLMFRNVDAELYGIDADFRADLTSQFRVEGTANWVRGKRLDIADNLYRIAPANLRLAAIWSDGALSAGAEMQAAAAQKRVSATNDEAISPGYAVFAIFGRAQLAPGVAVEAGAENLFNRRYAAHLSGLNRVGLSDVPVGGKLPGAGRGVWVRIGFSL